MDRRDAIRIGSAMAIYAGICDRQLPAATQKKHETILVIGAGIAGLAAARRLSSMGHHVTVLEGRDRLGGRIVSDHQFASPIDLGATWIHGTHRNPISRLAKQFGARTMVTDFDDVVVHDTDGRRLATTELDEIDSAFHELIEALETLADDIDHDISIQSALNHVLRGEQLDRAERRSLDYVVSSLVVTSGAELDELSLWYSDSDDSFAGPDAFFPGGFDKIVRKLANGLDIRLNHHVRQVRYDNQHVVAISDGGEFEADRAVVTLPLGVLQKQGVTFIPQLPARKRKAIDRLEMGVLNKVVLQFPHSFWAKRNGFLGYMSEAKGEFPVFMNLAKYTGDPILVALVGGDYARKLEKMNREQIAGQMMRVLRRIYGRIPDPERVAVTRWGRDPFAFGSYSHLPVGATDKDYDILADSVAQGRLLFAGEATHRRYPGTVHGAFLSGLRAAKQIAQHR